MTREHQVHGSDTGEDVRWPDAVEPELTIESSLGGDLEAGLEEPRQVAEPDLAEEPVPTLVESPPGPRATYHFPAGFLWGTATSSHQVEGDNTNNDWWTWEQVPERIFNNQRSGKACDWWQNAEKDFDLMAKLGLNAHRLSIEWSRVEPTPGNFDEAALERYRTMLAALRERGIEPMVTLFHFTLPAWLAQQGGWANPETIALFERFVGRVVDALGELCTLWCTINEPMVYVLFGYVQGTWPPGLQDTKLGMQVARNLLYAHAAAYRKLHERQPTARVGLAHNVPILDPARPGSPLDRLVAGLQDRVFNQAILTALFRGRWILPLGFGFVPRLRHTMDWIGLNYYTRFLVTFDRQRSSELFGRRMHAPDAELLDGEYGELYPQGLMRTIRRLARYKVPIYITENGIPDSDDDQRPRALLLHLHQMWKAIQFCYPVMGYFHWTMVDNFEWAEGWKLRFGLYELQRRGQKRVARPSSDLYADIVRANAITPDIVDRHVPQLRPVLLPE